MRPPRGEKPTSNAGVSLFTNYMYIDDNYILKFVNVISMFAIPNNLICFVKRGTTGQDLMKIYHLNNLKQVIVIEII